MASTVTTRAPAWADGVAVSGAEMRAAILGGIWANAGIVRGLVVVQIPTPAMKVRVPAGICVVSDGQNGYIPLELAAQTDLDIGASSPTLPRIDSVIAEFVDNGGSSLYRIRVVAGTPNASPVQPTLPYADQPTGKTLRLYNVAVAALATTIVDANISKQASLAYLASSGRLQNVSSDGGRPSSPATSETIWRTDKTDTEIYTGSTWVLGGLNPPYAQIGRSTDQSIPNSTLTAVLWTTEVSDSHAGHSTVTNTSRYTATVAGLYEVSCSLPWDPNATGVREMFFRINNTTSYAGDRSQASTVATIMTAASRLLRLAVNDYVEIVTWQNSGGALNISSSYLTGPIMDVVWLRS